MSSKIDLSKIFLVPATVTFLEMHEKKQYPQIISDTSFKLLHKPIEPSEYRRIYYSVGEKWDWLDRMVMPDEELDKKINADNTDIFLFYVNDQEAGFAEFVRESSFVEILYFGLIPEFIGKGYGKYFLKWVIAQAWSYKPEWIQLNTCTLDHPNAIGVYKNAGFTEVRKEVQERRKLS